MILQLVRANRTALCVSLVAQAKPPITTRPMKLAVSPNAQMERITMIYIIVIIPSAIENELFQLADKHFSFIIQFLLTNIVYF